MLNQQRQCINMMLQTSKYFSLFGALEMKVLETRHVPSLAPLEHNVIKEANQALADGVKIHEQHCYLSFLFERFLAFQASSCCKNSVFGIMDGKCSCTGEIIFSH